MKVPFLYIIEEHGRKDHLERISLDIYCKVTIISIIVVVTGVVLLSVNCKGISIVILKWVFSMIWRRYGVRVECGVVCYRLL